MEDYIFIPCVGVVVMYPNTLALVVCGYAIAKLYQHTHKGKKKK